jgi:hypothetical protein
MRVRAGARFMVMATLFAMLGIAPSRAETTSWNGSVQMEKTTGNPDHETIQYYLGDCRGDHPTAVLNAFIDVRAYEGKTLRFTPAADPPLWRLIKGTKCNNTLITGTLMSTNSAVEWVSSGPFLSISFSGSVSSSGNVRLVEASRYTLQVCPCS